LSKQQNEAEKTLRLLFNDLQSEVDLSKITNVKLHKGIRVDIWIPSIRCVVEIHGIQHHKPSGFGKNKVDTLQTYNRQLDRDSRLITICKEFDINYEQIDYNEKVDFATLFRRFNGYRTVEEDGE
jgi:hypothetical protein